MEELTLLSPCRVPYAEYRTAMSGGLLSPSSPAVPRSIAVCGAKNIGEMRSVTTRRGLKKTCNESNRGGLEYKQASDNCGSPSGFGPLATKKNEQIKV